MDSSDIIVIGLTGSFGSGCTTFAKFFNNFPLKNDARINLINFLGKRNYFKDKKGEIDFSGIDTQLCDFYSLLDDLENILKKDNRWIKEKEVSLIKNRIFKYFKEKSCISKQIRNIYQEYAQKNSNIEGLNRIKQLIFSEYKVLLEYREALNALNKSTSKLTQFVDRNNSKNHHFRKITISDIIIFKTILYYNAKVNVKGTKKKDIERYRKIIKQYHAKFNNYVKKDYKDSIGFYNEFQNVEDFISRDKTKRDQIIQLKEMVKKMAIDIRDAKDKIYPFDNYRVLMQDFGDNIRKNGNPYDYQTSYKKRNVNKDNKLKNNKEDTKYDLVRDVKTVINLLTKEGKHKVFIVDALRNPHEVLFLRYHFKNFYLISIFAPKEVRFERKVIERKISGKIKIANYRKIFDSQDDRDSGNMIKKFAEEFYMQNVPACSRLADININNYVKEQELGREEYDSKVTTVYSKAFFSKIRDYSFDDFEWKIIRYFALIIDKGCTKPSEDECLMNQAYAMAMRSNCISRQVGAIVVDIDGYITGAGWNDVGEGHISCGFIEVKDLEKGMFKEYTQEILGIKNLSNLREELITNFKYPKNTDSDHCVCIKDLISIKEKVTKGKLQYCRALHAEENAILQGSKRGGMGLKEGKIYTTAYPCSLCSKKISQVGIVEVIYDDPYPSNLSRVFLEEGENKVALRHFEGVKPLGYFKLFKPDYEQKEWQELEAANFVERYRYK